MMNNFITISSIVFLIASAALNYFAKYDPCCRFTVFDSIWFIAFYILVAGLLFNQYLNDWDKTRRRLNKLVMCYFGVMALTDLGIILFSSVSNYLYIVQKPFWIVYTASLITLVLIFSVIGGIKNERLFKK